MKPAPGTSGRLPPGPRLPVSLQTILFARYRHRWLPLLHRRRGATFLLRLAPHRRRVVALSEPADLRSVFAGPAGVFHAGEGNAILGPVMGRHSVLLLDEDEHLRIRRLLMPAFHGAPLHGYRELISELTRAEVDRWPSGTPLRLHDRMQSLTLEIILQVVFGVSDESRLARLRPVVDRVVGIKPVIMLGWFYPRLRRWWPWRGFAELQRELDQLLYAEIAQRRLAPDLAERSDVLSRLLRVSTAADGPGDSELTDAELRDNLITLLLAGHETTATALAWTFTELARNPDVQVRAQRAADESDEDYLEAVAKESLRLHPVIYEVARKLTAPIDLAGCVVPAGATVLPVIGLAHSDDRNHSDPTRLDPERFLGTQPAPNTWIPFGGGPRRCLGAGFALLETTVVLAEVLRRFDVAPDRARPERPKARNITLAPSRGSCVRLFPRPE